MRVLSHIPFKEKAKLDEKDKKILAVLSENARAPVTEIAHKLRLSKDVVHYRINRLEKENVICGYLAVIDTSKLGLASHHLFFSLNQINDEIRKKIKDDVGIMGSIKSIIEYSGKYNFEIAIAVKNVFELDEFYTKIIDSMSLYLQNYFSLAIIETFTYRAMPGKFPLNQKTSVKFEPDCKDLNLLGFISHNARAPLYEIGEKIKLTGDAVKYRIRKLESAGIIKKYLPIINYSRIGINVFCILVSIHNLTSEKKNRLNYYIQENESILWAVKTLGKFNLIMYIGAEEMEIVHNTIIELRELFKSDLLDSETLIAREEYVYTYFPDACKTN